MNDPKLAVKITNFLMQTHFFDMFTVIRMDSVEKLSKSNRCITNRKTH